MTNKKPRGYRVAPLKISDIRNTADEIRGFLQIKSSRLDIVSVYDFALPEAGIVVDICTTDQLGEKHGETFPDAGVIRIRDDVYEGAWNNQGRDRFTLAHELGHLVLHSGVALARGPGSGNHKLYEDSEWQADTFAAELLMPVKFIWANDSEYDLVERFGVSYDAARVRLAKLTEKGLLR